MKTLATQFTSNGFVFEQIEREGSLAIYRRFRQGGGQEHFETIRIKSHNGFKIPGTEKMTPPAEMYPSNEKWGSDGFTYHDAVSARKKLIELREKSVVAT